MSWKCQESECQFENDDDNSVVCACCGRARLSRLVLTSPAGTTWGTMVEVEVTRAVYRRLYPGVEHQYVPRSEGGHPYSIVRANTGEWQLLVNPSSPIRTVLNAEACEGGRRYGLKNGDSISIAPPTNAAKVYAPLTVSLLPVGRTK